jgi:hypothetical protein
VRGSLGSPLAGAAFSLAMERHGIIVIAALALVTVGHREDGSC